MISINIQKSKQKAVEIANIIANYLSQIRTSVQIFDYSEAYGYASVSVFIFIDDIIPLQIQSKYCVFGLGLDEQTLNNLKKFMGYEPSLLCHLEYEKVDELLQEAMPRLIDLIPKIPKYTPVIYDVALNELILLENEEFRISNILPLYEDQESLALHVEFQNSSSYSPASNIALFPLNSKEIIDYLLSILNCSPDLTFCIPNHENFNSPITPVQALKQYCDLTSLIRKPVLKALSEYCILIEKKKEIEFLTSLKGREEFRKVIEDKYLSIPEIIDMFGIKIPIGDLVQILDKIKPRLYTIASSFDIHQSIHIAININKKGRYVGVVSRVLENFYRTKYESLRGYLKPSVFHLCEGAPLLMIATGSGLAPFRSLLLTMQLSPDLYPKVILILGFRTSSHFYYKNELEKMIKNKDGELEKYEHHSEHLSNQNKIVDSIFVAYSRQNEKNHVQDVINYHSSKVLEILRNGVVYLCGGSAMGKNVIQTLKRIAVENSDEEFWKNCQQKFQIEVWG